MNSSRTTLEPLSMSWEVEALSGGLRLSMQCLDRSGKAIMGWSLHDPKLGRQLSWPLRLLLWLSKLTAPSCGLTTNSPDSKLCPVVTKQAWVSQESNYRQTLREIEKNFASELAEGSSCWM